MSCRSSRPGNFAACAFSHATSGLDARGVDDEQIYLAGKPVGVEIVNHAAALVAHQGVLALAGRELADVIGQDAIQEIRRAPRR